VPPAPRRSHRQLLQAGTGSHAHPHPSSAHGDVGASSLGMSLQASARQERRVLRSPTETELRSPPNQANHSQVSVERFLTAPWLSLWGLRGYEAARDPSRKAPAAQHRGESLAPTSWHRKRTAQRPKTPKCFAAAHPGLTALPTRDNHQQKRSQ